MSNRHNCSRRSNGGIKKVQRNRSEGHTRSRGRNGSITKVSIYGCGLDMREGQWKQKAQ